MMYFVFLLYQNDENHEEVGKKNNIWLVYLNFLKGIPLFQDI